jgi:hypothetical protein
MMIPNVVACVFVAVALAGCCASNTGCETPMPASPVAWDGLGKAPSDATSETDPKFKKPPKREIVAAPIGEVLGNATPRTKKEWDKQEDTNRADDAKLAKQLMICQGCSPPAKRNDEAAGNVSR